MLVVDEEQRFGVAHKERIKQMRRKVDVLTLSATPIPRTLNMSLVGIRDMSIIETPPKDRLSIQTNVVKFDSHVIARAIRHELERGGQVYFVHNRVESIFSIGDSGAAAGARGARGRGARTDGRGRARARDARLHQQEVRRPPRDDDHREWARYPERQHDPHQSRRSLRSVAAVPAARPRGPFGSTGLCVSADSARRRRCRRSRRSGLPPFASSAILAADSGLRRSISRFAAPVISWAANRAATSRPSASRCT